MNEIYLTIADGFEKLAAGYRALAGNTSAPVVSESATEAEVPSEAVSKKSGKLYLLCKKSLQLFPVCGIVRRY